MAATAVAKEIGGLAVACDVSDAKSAEAAVATARGAHGAARVLINCAGIGPAQRIVGRDGPMPLDAFKRVIDINLIGSFNLMRLAAADMTGLGALDDGERGVIVSTASVAAYEGQIGQAAYSASKGGIVALTLPAAREFSRSGIRVNAMAPGLFATPLLLGMPQPVQDSLGAERAVPLPLRQARGIRRARPSHHRQSHDQRRGDPPRRRAPHAAEVGALLMRAAAAVSAGGDLVDGAREHDVAIGHAVDIVGCEDYFHPIIDIEPLGMVIHLFRDEGHLGHEGPGLAKGAEVKRLADGVAILDLGPAAELLDGGGPLHAVKPFCHGDPPLPCRLSKEVAPVGAKIKRSRAPWA